MSRVLNLHDFNMILNRKPSLQCSHQLKRCEWKKRNICNQVLMKMMSSVEIQVNFKENLLTF